MNPLLLLDAVADHGPTLLLGATVLLGLGIVACRGARTPASRRRLGVWAAVATTLYLVTAGLPCPRPTYATWSAAASAWASPEAAVRPAAEPPPGPDEATATGHLPGSPGNEHPPPAPLELQILRVDALDQPTAEPPAAAAATASAGWRRALVVLWLGVGATLLGRTLLGCWRLGRLLRTSRAAPAESLGGAGLPTTCQVRIASPGTRPFCTGWRRPVIVLPADLLAADRAQELRAVLRHEAAHLAARDPLVLWLFQALALPLGAHPLLHWLWREVRFQAERLADETAARGDRTAYARALLAFAERHPPTIAVGGALPVFQAPSEFFRRIEMLLQPTLSATTPPLFAKLGHGLFAAGLLAIATLAPGLDLPAQEPAPAAAPAAALAEENARLRQELAELRSALLKQPPATHPGTPDQDPTGAPPVATGTPGPATTDAVLDLATRCIDLQTELAVAEAAAVQQQELAKAGHATPLAAKAAVARLDNLQRKLQALKRLLAGEAAVTQAEIDAMQRQLRDTDKRDRPLVEARIRRLSLRLEVLRDL